MNTALKGASLVLERVRRPDPDLLVALESYDRDAFGPAGLRTYDLAIMAEAGAVFVARVGEEIVGGCQVMRVLDEPGFCYVVGFYVRPAWQGAGFGRRLLDLLRRECESRGAEGMILTVAPDNAQALSLYRSAGFAEEARIARFYGEGEDRYVLRLRFAERGLSGGV